MKLPRPTQERIAALCASAFNAHQRRMATWEQLDEKSCLGLDAPPGIGWRLVVKGRAPRFYATREQAIQAWDKDRNSFQAEERLTEKRA